MSALESYRFHHQRDPIYQECPESHQPLRQNSDIRLIERGCQASEPKRQAESQQMKADGVISRESMIQSPNLCVKTKTFLETFTREQLCEGAMEFLSSAHKGKSKIALAARDRAMLLLSTSTAMRGDNTRPILLSDLYSKDVPLVDVGLDFKVKVRILYIRVTVCLPLNAHKINRHLLL